ncbi:MAG: FG-GAP-like repeat-containing protein, partial [Trichodesmium sp. St7_bin2_1]|nr:FG-GAP-like repeat-containing protein [Trichodesmium sp. St7_bin2_1]
GNDYLYGGIGNDTYIFEKGHDSDIVIEKITEGSDVIYLTDAIKTKDIRLWTDSSGDLHIINKDTNDKIEVYADKSDTDGTNQSLIGKYVEKIIFDDETTLDLTGSLNIEGSNIAEDLYGTAMNDTVAGMGGNDFLYGNSGDDILSGELGNDYLYGGIGNDFLYGGKGLDVLGGEEGADTFIFKASSAFNNVDTINDYTTTDGDAINIANLLMNYKPNEDNIHDFVKFTQISNNTILSVDKDGKDTIFSSKNIIQINNVIGLDLNNMIEKGELLIVNKAPTDLTINKTIIDENKPPNSVVGEFSTTDLDSENDFTYALVTGEGDTDNSAFTIENDKLKINDSPDYEIQPNYNIRVQTTDDRGASYEKKFTINVKDIEENELTQFDFNGDGIADIFWRNKNTGDNKIWLTGGDSKKDTVVNPGSFNPVWDVAGIADFNNDQVPDILWRHESSGANKVWLMNDDATRDSVVNPGGFNPVWDVAGIADFNNDQVPDILWRHESSAANKVWLMNDDATLDSVVNPGSFNPVWDVAGIADFNNDQVPDILWRHESS